MQTGAVAERTIFGQESPVLGNKFIGKEIYYGFKNCHGWLGGAKQGERRQEKRQVATKECKESELDWGRIESSAGAENREKSCGTAHFARLAGRDADELFGRLYWFCEKFCRELEGVNQ